MLNRRAILSCLASSLVLAGAGAAHSDVPGPWAPRALTAGEIGSLRSFRHALERDIPEISGMPDLIMDHIRLRLSEDHLFTTGTADLHPDGVRLLTLIAARLQQRPVRLEIVAHHHSDGQSYRSFIISERRAQAVRAAMLSRQVPGDRLLATGLGENFPIATNHTASGRATNRRVDLLFRTP